MTLTELSDAVIAQLLSDQGTSAYWNATDIKTDANWLYRDVAESFECCKKRDTSTVTVVDTARYAIPIVGNVSSIIKMINVEYNNEPVPFKTIEELEDYDYRWRSLGSGLPICCTFEKGDENSYITLVPKCSTADVILAMTFIYLPIDMTANTSPVHPLTDGRILKDGLMSIQLAKAGGGRDLDRSDWYFQQFLSKCTKLGAHKGFGIRGLKSIESSSSQTIKSRSFQTPITEV